MASFEQCINDVTEAVGRPLTADEEKRVGKQFGTIVKKLRIEQHAEAFDALLMKEIQAQSDLAQAGALIKKRNAVKNKVAVLKKIEHLETVWADDPVEGVRAMLVGSMTGRKTGKASIANLQSALSDAYMMGVAADLDKAGLTQWVGKGTYDKEIWNAMWELNRPEPDAGKLAALPQEAKDAAAILNKWNETARIHANKAGAWIKKLDGYVTRHSHDQERISTAGKDQWVNDVTEWLDWEKSMPDAAPEERLGILQRMFSDFKTGTHVKFQDAPTAGFTGETSAAKQLSFERVLHFKSADAEFAYNQKYGSGNLREAIFNNLSRMGRETALMRELGPSARYNYETIMRHFDSRLRDIGQDAARETLVTAKRTIDRTIWPLLDGDIFRVENATMARWSANVRGIEMMSDLGMATVTSITDLPIIATATRQQGVGMLRGITEALGSLLRGYNDGERMHVIAETGVILDSVRNALADRYDVSGGQTGAVAKATKLYFGLNLLRPWTDRLRGGFVLATAHRLANHSALDFAELPPGMQHLLKQYGIDTPEWNIIRQGKESHADGKAFLTPEGLSDLSPETFASYAAKGDTPASHSELEAAREGLKDKLRSFFRDQATTAVVEPDAATRALMLQGTHRGTIHGEVMRHFGMYKSFTMSVMRRVMGRELFGYSDTKGGIMPAILAMIKDPTGSPFVGMANLIAFTTVFGYAAINLKDLMKGREPRQPETAGEYAALLSASLAQGGGLGLYGDFLFGESKSRYGQGPLESFLGPTWRRADDLKGLADALKEGQDVKGRAITKVFNNIPFVNLFYTRWAMDYLILYRLQEMSNPGYLRRMEQRVRDEKHQQFIVPPSQVIP